jgi:hypothetical protein
MQTHGVRGSTRPQDIETALQLTYLTFTDPAAIKVLSTCSGAS